MSGSRLATISPRFAGTLLKEVCHGLAMKSASSPRLFWVTNGNALTDQKISARPSGADISFMKSAAVFANKLVRRFGPCTGRRGSRGRKGYAELPSSFKVICLFDGKSPCQVKLPIFRKIFIFRFSENQCIDRGVLPR